MKRWSASLLRIFFAIVILCLAAAASVTVRAVFHPHSGLIPGIAFIATLIFALLYLERKFPAVYAGLRQRPWWQGRLGEAIVGMVLAIIMSILSSKIATLWFGALIISGVLIALLLRATRKDDEL